MHRMASIAARGAPTLAACEEALRAGWRATRTVHCVTGIALAALAIACNLQCAFNAASTGALRGGRTRPAALACLLHLLWGEGGAWPTLERNGMAA